MPGILALAVAYLLSQFYRSFLAVLTPYLERDLGVAPATLSDALSVWFLVFAVAQFPIGWALDRVSPRWTAALLLGLGGGGGAALFAWAEDGGAVVAAMALIGLGCAPVLMASLYIYARRFDAARFATLAATLIAVGTLGNVLASAPLVAVVEAVGWRGAAWGLAGITVAVAATVALTVEDPDVVETEARGSLWDLLRLPALWTIFPLMFVNYAAPMGLRGLWAGPYFGEVHGLGPDAVGAATLWMAIAMALGSAAYGPLDRLFGTRKWVAAAGNGVVALMCLYLAVATPSAGVAIAAFVAIGFFGLTYAVIMAHGKAFCPPHLIGRGVTLLNFFSIGGVGALQGATSRLMAGGGAGVDDYQRLFAFYAAALAGALAIYVFSRDARP